MKVLVVDNESFSREQIRQLLKGMKDVELSSQDAREGREAVSLVQQWHPDVVLMKTEMSPGDMGGIQAAEYMTHLAPPPAVILCSANPDDALKAYDVHAAGFLVQPFSEHKLSEAIEFASHPNQLQIKNIAAGTRPLLGVNSNMPYEQAQPQHISAKTHRGIELIPIKNILCFKADNKYVTVYHTGGEVLIDRTLKSLHDQLGDRFIRIHRNALVAKVAITGLERKHGGSYFIRLSALDMVFSVSRRHVPIMRKIIKTL